MTPTPAVPDTAVLREQVRMHRAGLPLAVGSGTALALILLATLWSHVPLAPLLSWYGAVAVAGLGSLALARAHRRKPDDLADDEAWHRWRRRYHLALAARALAWGLSGLLVWPAGEPGLQMLMVTALVAVCASTLLAAPFDRPAAWLFLGLAFGPLAVRLLALAEHDAVALVGMLMVLAATMAATAHRASRRARRHDALRRLDATRTQALQRSERQLRDAEQLAGIGSFDWLPVSGDLHWSDQHFRIWGLEAGSVVPSYQVFRDAIHADDLERVERELKASLRGGQPLDSRYRIVRGDGSLREVHSHGEVALDEHGMAVRMLGTVQDVTEQRRAKAALRTFEFVLNAIADPVSVVDEGQCYRLVNDAWCAVNGKRREDVLGQSTTAVFPSAASEPRRQALRDCIATGHTAVVRGPSPGAQSASTTLETQFFPFAVPQVDWRGAVMITRDISDLVAHEAALSASVDNLRLTLNTTGDAIFASDAKGPNDPVLFVNDQLLQLWDIPAEMAERVTPALIIEKARPWFIDPEREVARIQEIIACGTAQEDRITLRDGRVLVRRCIPTLQAERQVRVWGFRDVTSEAQAAQRLRDSEARLRALLDAFPGYISAVDADVNYVYANARLAELLERTPQQVIGCNPDMLFGPQQAASIRDEVRRTLAGDTVSVERHYPPTARRAAVDLLITLAAGRQSDGRSICYAFGADVSALKRSEAALVTARDEAERANRAKSQFLSNMSHELRTTLNAVLGYGHLLERNTDGRLDDKQLRQVREILRGGKHLLALIDDLLDLARIEAGHIDVVMQPVHLQPLCEECLQLMQPMAERFAVRLEPLHGGAELAVQADRRRLKQVLLNLLSNAVKYNHKHGWVALSFDADGADGSVRLQVRDSGPGLDAAAQARLFQPFERLGAGQGHTEGTGIGLSLSQQLVHLMQGDIGVQSKVGSGCAFWVRLARAERAPMAIEREAAGAMVGSPGGAGPDAAGAVLYIDDNPVNLALVEALLEERPGLRVLTTASPHEGLHIAAHQRLALLLVDLHMPEVDGHEVLRRLRLDPATRNLPVVAVSADAMPEVVEACLARGFDDFMAKPVDACRLLQVVDRAVRGGGA